MRGTDGEETEKGSFHSMFGVENIQGRNTVMKAETR